MLEPLYSPDVSAVPAFRSRSRRSKAFLYDSWSLQLPNSPMWRVRRMSAAHACVASITASSTRMGNSTGFLLRSSRSKAACTSRSTHGLTTEFSESTSSSLSCTRIDSSIRSGIGHRFSGPPAQTSVFRGPQRAPLLRLLGWSYALGLQVGMQPLGKLLVFGRVADEAR